MLHVHFIKYQIKTLKPPPSSGGPAIYLCLPRSDRKVLLHGEQGKAGQSGFAYLCVYKHINVLLTYNYIYLFLCLYVHMTHSGGSVCDWACSHAHGAKNH